MRALNLQDLKMSDYKKNNDWKLQHLENDGPNRSPRICKTWKMTDQLLPLEFAIPGKWRTKSQGLKNAGPGKWRTSHNQKVDTARFNTSAVNNKLVDRLLSGAPPQRLVASPDSCLSPTVSMTHEYSDQYGEQRKRLRGFGKRSWICVRTPEWAL